jgi:hypothetical protein
MNTKFAACALAALALAAAGCGGNSQHAASTGAAGGGAPSGATLPTSTGDASKAATALLGGAGGPLDVSKLCAAVKQADVQKLFKDTAPPVTANPGECDWASGGITLDIYNDDASKQYYNGGAVNVASATPLPGVGDEAVWTQPVQGATVPVIAAHKGSTTCTITPGLNVDQTTMSYTGHDPFYKIDPASASQYAAEEGQLCNEIFATDG